VADSLVISNPEKFRFQIENSRIQIGSKEIVAFQNDVSSIDLKWFQKDGNYICFGNKTLVIVDKDFKVFPTDDKFQSDFIIYSQNSPLSIAKLCESFNFELLIIGPSNSFWKAEKIKEECARLGIDYYCVQDRGAWVCNLTGN
jgi:hypothetical protein